MPDEKFVEMVENWIADIRSGICPNCRKKFTGVTRANCVYCDHCGERLYAIGPVEEDGENNGNR